MKKEIKTPLLIAALVVLVVGIIAFGAKYMGGVGELDHGQIAYTPGVPPWEEKDPSKKAQFEKMPGELRTNSQAATGQHVPASFQAGK